MHGNWLSNHSLFAEYILYRRNKTIGTIGETLLLYVITLYYFTIIFHTSSLLTRSLIFSLSTWIYGPEQRIDKIVFSVPKILRDYWWAPRKLPRISSSKRLSLHLMTARKYLKFQFLRFLSSSNCWIFRLFQASWHLYLWKLGLDKIRQLLGRSGSNIGQFDFLHFYLYFAQRNTISELPTLIICIHMYASAALASFKFLLLLTLFLSG